MMGRIAMGSRILALFIGVTLAMGCKKDGDGSAFKYDKNYEGSYNTGGTSMHLASGREIGFTLSWNEANGVVTGFYQDDYFAPNGVNFTGSVSEQVWNFTVPLSDVIDGVQSLSFAIISTNDGLSATIQGSGVGGATVFAAGNVLLKATSTGAGGNTKPSSVDGFFAQIAGTYTWEAKLTGKKDTTWTPGKTYDVVIGADKKVTIPTDAGSIEFTYGDKPADSFEAYDHEAYIIVQRDPCKILIQHEFADNKKVMSCTLGDAVSGSFWSFKEADGEASETSVMGSLGLADAVGDFEASISAVTGQEPHDLKLGDKVSFSVDGDGNVSGDFGDFSYGDDTFQQTTATSGGEEEQQLYWYSPNKSDANKKILNLILKDGTFKTILLTVEKDGKNRSYGATLKK